MKMSWKDLTKRLKETEQKINEIFLPSDNDYANSINNLKQSIRQRQNWQQKRFIYQTGINRANRRNPYKDIRPAFLNNMDKNNLYKNP